MLLIEIEEEYSLESDNEIDEDLDIQHCVLPLPPPFDFPCSPVCDRENEIDTLEW